MTIGIVGTRRRDGSEDFAIVYDAFGRIAGIEDRIVSGGCGRGADRFAELIARREQRTITIHYAPWRRMGNIAGFHRNAFVAADSDKLIACVAGDRTGGTEDTINKFLRLHDESDLILV